MYRKNNRISSVLLTGLLLVGMLSGCTQTARSESQGSPHVSVSVTMPAPDTSAQQERKTPVVQPAPVPTEQKEPQETAQPKPEEPSAQVCDPPEEPSVQESEKPEGPAAQVSQTAAPEEIVAETVEVKVEEEELEDETVALSGSPAALPVTASAVATGILTKESLDAVIDYSNTKDGYVMVQYTTQTDSRLKVQVKGPTTTYTYNLAVQKWAALPLSDGNGNYRITIYKNVSGTKYAAVLSLTIQVDLVDEFAPFLHSNQYVNFDAAPNTVMKAAQLTGRTTDPLKKVEAVYDYVVKELTYDKELAASVKSGYLPELDKVLDKKSGICFDYAALMTGMLRSQGVPCKLVVGYAGTAYHAWISVWIEGTGWVDGVIWFDGTGWQRMDPTFASSGNSSESIMAYIGDGKNYSAKYFY